MVWMLQVMPKACRNSSNERGVGRFFDQLLQSLRMRNPDRLLPRARAARSHFAGLASALLELRIHDSLTRDLSATCRASISASQSFKIRSR